MTINTSTPLERILCEKAPIDALGRAMIVSGLKGALSEPSLLRKSTIDAVCRRLKSATNPSRVILPVMECPHPAFLDTILSHFGEGVFNDLADKDGTPCYPELNFKPLSVRLDPGYCLRIFALLIRARKAPHVALHEAAKYCLKTDSADLFDEICTQAGLARTYLAQHLAQMNAYGPLKPNFALWCAELFEECHVPGSALEHQLLEDAYKFHNAHLYAAIIAAGGKPQALDQRSSRHTPAWLKDTFAQMQSRHGHMALLSRLRAIGGTECLFSAGSSALTNALFNKEAVNA